MSGSYRMVDDRGTTLGVVIPAFSLDSPAAVRTLN